MNENIENLAPSKRSAAKTLFATFKILKEAGGQLPGKKVIEKIRESVELTEWEKQVYEKTGYVRWESILHFYSIDGIKAGFLRKNKGVWYLTAEGEKAIKLGPAKLLETASELYSTWATNNKGNKPKKTTAPKKTRLNLRKTIRRPRKLILIYWKSRPLLALKTSYAEKTHTSFRIWLQLYYGQ